MAIALSLLLLLTASAPLAAGTSVLHSPPRGSIPLAAAVADHAPTLPAVAGQGSPAPRDSSLLPSSFFNTTVLSPGGRPLGVPEPVSVIGSEPQPSRPPTVPSEVQFLVNVSSGAARQNFAVPAGGPWAKILLNFTGSVIPDVYDSSYRAYVDGVLVMFGTTPEYGTWTVLSDLTRYSALFHGNVSFYFQLSAADITGHFLENVSLLFYPLLPGEAPPVVAGSILPFWTTPYVHSATPVVWADVSVPSNVTNASLELWTYGFGPQDEFWYLQNPNFRGLQVSVDGTRVLTLLPFEYINTGGIDLFLWRPVTSVMTSNDRAVQFDATPMLGLLEGTHNISVSMEGITSPGDTWLVGANLFMNTSAGTGPAATTLFHYSGETKVSAGLDERVNYTYQYGSRISTAAGTEWANETLVGLFSSNMTEVGAWQNLSLVERQSANSSLVLGSTLDRSLQVLNFPFAADLSGTFVLTGTTGGGYPEFGNFTTELLNVVQDWNQSLSSSAKSGALPAAVASSHLSLRLDGASGVYGGTEELTSPGTPVITGFTSDVAANPKTVSFTESRSGAQGNSLHSIVGDAYNPPGPYNVESITTNELTASVGVTLLLSSTSLAPQAPLTLTAVASGGSGWIDYAWSGLPPGCTSFDSAVLSCHPSTPGTYYPAVTATDALGDSNFARSVPLTVSAAVAAQITGLPSATDQGVTLQLEASVTGGISPYSCSWSVDAALIQIQPCSQAFTYVLNGSSPLNLSLLANDSVGSLSPLASAQLTVNAPPSVALLAPPSSAVVGASVRFESSVLGGTGPFLYSWGVDGVLSAPTASSEFNYTFTKSGNHQVTVALRDAAGLAADASPATVLVSTPSSVASTSSSTPGYWPYVAAAGWAAAAAAAVLLLLLRRRPPKARSPPRPAYSERPKPGPP
ncbi:MAG TPA: peptide-N4-asparagine amidase [Thermoplasmata archaeon]|nr:peptide-N4-asparagine amidase [Thermoplasmata archaeon]